MPRLSPQQRHILLYVYAEVQDADQPQGAVPLVRWGVDGDTVFRASTSRALKRLESHGLLRRLHYTAGKVRESEANHHRTTHVTLTPAGLDLAHRLTAPGVVGC